MTMKLVRFGERRTGLVVELPTGPHVIDIVASVGTLLPEDPVSSGVLNGILREGGSWAPLIEHWTYARAGLKRLAEVALRREDLPEPAAHEFYQVDLIGLEVVNGQGECLGRVAGFIATGANDVMRVEHEGGERLVPARAEVTRKVDLAAGTVEVDWGADW